jgi:hypothetical protein
MGRGKHLMARMRRGRQVMAVAGGLLVGLCCPSAALAAQVPVPTTTAALQISATGAQLTGTVNPGGPSVVSYRFAYGTSPTSLTHLTSQITGPSGTALVPLSAAVTGLSPNTTYYFQLVVRFNRVSYSGAVQSFTTLQVPVATTGAASGLTPGTATLAGVINPGGPLPVSYQFAYGTSSSHLDHTTPSTVAPGGSANSPISAAVGGLSPGTTYYFRLDVGFAGQTVSGVVQNFTTPQVPVVTTQTPSGVSPDAAVLTGTVNPSGPQTVSYRFAYGTSVAGLSATTAQQRLAAGSSAHAISAPIGGLSPDTTYYYRLDVTVSGQTYSSPVQSFTTRIPQPGATNAHASWITNIAATVGGQVSPHGFATTYHFDYGTTAAYGRSSPALSAGTGSGDVAVSFTLPGLRPGTTYHYRLVAQSAGGTVVGDDQQFTTGAVLLRPPQFAFRTVRRQRLGPALRGGVAVKFSCGAACTARFAVTLAPGFLRGARLPATLARRDASLAGAGSGTVWIKFSPAVRRRLAGRRLLKLTVSAYAVGDQTRATTPQLAPLTLFGR